MAAEVEAMGGLATAALAAHALDADRGRAGVAHGRCANCGAALAGEFCHACGQSAHVHRSVGHVLEEFLHGVWHFDSRAWRTLPLLAFRPGRLTHDYIHGKRARYIAPLALFLLSVFLMFFVFGFVGPPEFGGDADAGQAREAQQAVVALKRDIATAERARAAATARGDAAATREAANEATALRAALAAAHDVIEAAAPPGTTTTRIENGVAETYVKIDDGRSFINPVTLLRVLDNAQQRGDLKVDTGSAAIDANIRSAIGNPELAVYKVKQTGYKLSFLLVPLSLPALWLLFCWRRDVTIYDHTVFALYSLSFMSLLFVLVVLLFKASVWTPVLGSLAGALLLIVPPLHMFAQLRGGYRLSVGGTLLRTVILSIATLLTLSLFVTLIVVLGLGN